MLDNLKKQHNSVLAHRNKIRNLSRQRETGLFNVDRRQHKRVIERQQREIRNKFDSQLYEQAALANQIAGGAQQTLEMLDPVKLREQAEFTGGGIDELAWSQRVTNTTPGTLPDLASVVRHSGNLAASRVMRRELARRDDVDTETHRDVLEQLDAMPLPDSVIESAQVALEIIQHARRCEHEARATIKGHRLDPIERLASARELQATQRQIDSWATAQAHRRRRPRALTRAPGGTTCHRGHGQRYR